MDDATTRNDIVMNNIYMEALVHFLLSFFV